jgi:protein-S-isoprenylcysteine O-methyltransferase Ste14
MKHMKPEPAAMSVPTALLDDTADACPASAVSHGVGMAGMIGLGLWILVAWNFGTLAAMLGFPGIPERLNGPNAGLAGVLACGLPMVLWSIFVDKVHKRPSTGIDWNKRKPLREVMDVSIVKLVGLWTTWGTIAFAYFTAAWYWQGNYRMAMDLMLSAAPFIVIGSIPYVLWLDRYLVEPKDGAFAFGQWLIGGQAGKPAAGAIANHARSWLVKGFFLAFMLSIVPGNFSHMVNFELSNWAREPVLMANFLISLMFVIDVAFATVGYMLTMRPLDAHIRSANPFLAGWVAALICYPPFVLMGGDGPLFYEQDTRDWAFWFADQTTVLWVWGGILVLLTAVYAWATVAFGLRFSNLTHRGILTHGPYRLTKHPAYLAKNTFWWLTVLPFLVTTDSTATAIRNTILLGLTSAVYYWRARTEEKHLSEDPAYVAYAGWMERNGPVPRIIAVLRGRRPVVTPEG